MIGEPADTCMLESATKWIQCASNGLARPMGVTNMNTIRREIFLRFNFHGWLTFTIL